jgi:hypothetical protein
VAVARGRGTAEGAGAEGADTGRGGDGGRAEGIDSERMGRMRHADGPCVARGCGGLCGRGKRGRVRARRRGEGMAVVYTIVLIVSREVEIFC